MKQSVSYNDREISEIKRACADEIIEFGKQLKTIKCLYEQFGISYPTECRTNYRDSWFHYRKLYNKKDIISILNEKYGMEEHLIRATKDAQIYFLQVLACWLEKWYKPDDYFEYNISEVILKNKMYGLRINDDCNWVEKIWQYCGDSRDLFTNLCLFYFMNNILDEKIKEILKKLIHSLKNMILELRLGGINIYRPSDNVYFAKESIELYNSIVTDLHDTGLLNLLSATDLILYNCSKKSE